MKICINESFSQINELKEDLILIMEIIFVKGVEEWFAKCVTSHWFNKAALKSPG